MVIGCPKEIKNQEYRVGLTPSNVADYIRHGNKVIMETGAGIGSGFTDEEYKNAGAEIDAGTNEGYTALMGAAIKGNMEMAQVLLDAGADINHKAPNGKTALIMAQEKNQDEMVNFLKSNGAE